MINLELIAGMIFMAFMEDNEATEIVGAERFLQYVGVSLVFCPALFSLIHLIIFSS